MGKFFSLFSKKKKKTPEDRKRQASVLHKVSKSPEMQWKEPEHRWTVIEGGEAAQRLSVFQREPQDTEEKKQYIKDKEKVNAAVEVLKQNAKANRERIKVAIEQAEYESNDPNDIHQNDEKKTDSQIEINNETKENTQIVKKNNINDETKEFEHGSVNISYTNDKEDTSEPNSHQPSYSGFRIQIDQLQSFHNDPWIINKNKPGTNSLQPIIKHSELINNIDEYHKNKRVTLTNSHNFLWFVSAIQSSVKYAENETELTRSSLDKILNLLPIPFRDKIWEICVEEEDEIYLYIEDYIEFVDALLVATGQYDIDDDIDEIDFEMRDMTQVFCAIIDIDGIFKNKLNTDKWSKTASCLSTKGATEIVLRARNLKSRNDIIASDDVSIALLTGFTRKAMKHALLFCTRVFWKLLTGVWWDEDDEEDMALPVSLAKYENNLSALDVPNNKKKTHIRGKRSTKLSENQINSINGTSLEVLFPDLTIDDDESCSFNKYLKVIE